MLTYPPGAGGGVQAGSSNTFTGANMFAGQLEARVADGSDPTYGPEFHWFGANGAWGIGIDVADPTYPSQDLAIFRYLINRTLTDAVLVNGSTTLTSASAAFTNADNGQLVYGKGIQQGTRLTVQNATTATLSLPAVQNVNPALVFVGMAGVNDCMYFKHRGALHSTASIGKTPADDNYRLWVVGPADGVNDLGMGTLCVQGGWNATGDLITAKNWGTSNIWRLKSDGSMWATLPAVNPTLDWRNSSNTTLFRLDGTGASQGWIGTQLFGIGTQFQVAAPANPGATLDLAMGGTNNATLKVRTQSWGSLQIMAAGSSPGDSSIATQNSTALTLGTVAVTAVKIDTSQNVMVGKASPAVSATAGFPYVPVMAGAPTGTPTAVTGFAPLVVDSTNGKLWAYVGGAWKGAALT